MYGIAFGENEGESREASSGQLGPDWLSINKSAQSREKRRGEKRGRESQVIRNGVRPALTCGLLKLCLWTWLHVTDRLRIPSQR